MLAIVIPYYKLTFFAATLDSLAQQTDQRFKVYIGDDASPEDPTELLKRYQGTFDWVCHRFEKNVGSVSLVQQWERCIALTQEEEWLMILGDDDVLGLNCIAAFYEKLHEVRQTDAKVIRYATQVIDENGHFISAVYQHPKLELATDFLSRKLKGGTRSSLSEYVFIKEIVLAIKFKELPLAWYSDLLAVLEFSQFGLLYTINDSVVNFRLSKLNITGSSEDVLIKNNATFQFYFYLLENHSNKFSKHLQMKLLDNLEKTLLDNKINIHKWLQLFYLYGKFLQLQRFLSLSLKIKKSIQ